MKSLSTVISAKCTCWSSRAKSQSACPGAEPRQAKRPLFSCRSDVENRHCPGCYPDFYSLGLRIMSVPLVPGVTFARPLRSRHIPDRVGALLIFAALSVRQNAVVPEQEDIRAKNLFLRKEGTGCRDRSATRSDAVGTTFTGAECRGDRKARLPSL